jgi:DNA-binding NarL/FixJ family response regulator
MRNHKQSLVSVFLVDDHPLVRQGLALMLEQAGFTISGEADGAKTALAHAGLASAQVVVLDLSLDRTNGLDLIPTLRRRGIRVVVYSMHEEVTIIRRALSAGAKGYVTKREAAQSLTEAIRTALDGGTFVSPRAAPPWRITSRPLSR